MLSTVNTLLSLARQEYYRESKVKRTLCVDFFKKWHGHLFPALVEFCQSLQRFGAVGLQATGGRFRCLNLVVYPAEHSTCSRCEMLRASICIFFTYMLLLSSIANLKPKLIEPSPFQELALSIVTEVKGLHDMFDTLGEKEKRSIALECEFVILFCSQLNTAHYKEPKTKVNGSFVFHLYYHLLIPLLT